MILLPLGTLPNVQKFDSQIVSSIGFIEIDLTATNLGRYALSSIFFKTALRVQLTSNLMLLLLTFGPWKLVQ